MANEQDCDRLYWRAVRIEKGSNCAAAGQGGVECGGPIGVHHVAGRANAVRFNTELGVCLCEQHHIGGRFSAHGTPKRFIEWWAEEFTEAYITYCDLRRKIVSDRDMDYDAIKGELSEIVFGAPVFAD